MEAVAETDVSATANRTDDPASLVGEFFVEAVVHGDQLAVDQQVDVALVGSVRVVVWETILAPTRSRRTSEA